MSTTLNKLEYLDETKKQIKTALNQFGAGITDETTFREYADKIDDIYDNWEKVTAENTAITLDNTKAGLMKAELKGNTEQVQYTGKNFFDISKVLTNGNSLINNGNTLTINTSAYDGSVKSSSANTLGDYCPNMQAGDEIYIYATSTGASKYIYLGDTSKRINFNADSPTVITQEDLNSAVYWYASGVSTSAVISNIMITTTQNADYEPFVGNQPSPSPSYPQPIQVVKGSNTININEELLLPNDFEQGGISYSPGNTYEFCKSHSDVSVNNYRIRTKNLITLDKNKTYKINCSSDFQYVVQTFNNNQLFDTLIPEAGNWQNNQIQITNVPYIAVAMRKKDSSTIAPTDININDISLIEVNQQTYPITLPNGMELCKIGDYQDYIYKSGDNWFLEKKVEKIVLDGTEDWVVYGSASEEYVRYSIALSKQYITNIGLSNILTENESKVYGKNGIAFWIYLNQLRVCVSLTEFPDVASFKNFLLTTNMIAYIVLENPTTTPITDTTLINQLNAIEENLKSYNDQTNILQTNDDLPFIINASALKKGGN